MTCDAKPFFVSFLNRQRRLGRSSQRFSLTEKEFTRRRTCGIQKMLAWASRLHVRFDVLSSSRMVAVRAPLLILGFHRLYCVG